MRGFRKALVKNIKKNQTKVYHFPTLEIESMSPKCTKLTISSSHSYTPIWIYQKEDKSILSWPGGGVEIYVWELGSGKDSHSDQEDSINLTMPGKVVEIKVKEGESIKKGDCLLIVEAMKMENNILSPRDSVIKKLHVEKGEHLEAGAILVSFEKS